MMKKNILRYAIASTAGAALAFSVMCFKGIFSQDSLKTVFTILCDSFFVAGICLFCVGAIVAAAGGGAFDMLGYAVVMIFDGLRKNIGNRKYKDFYEYRKAKSGRKHSSVYLLIIGGVFVAVSLVFLGVYYKM